MKDEKMKELMNEYLEGNLTGELKQFVANHIKKTKKWQVEFERMKQVAALIDRSTELEPPAEMKTGFETMLAQQIEEQKQSSSREARVVYWNSPRQWQQIAATVLILIVGGFIGYKINSNQNREEIMTLKKEMAATKQIVLASLNNQSASSRLNAVNVSNQLAVMDIEITNALIETLNNDANANVRLAAMEALSKFADEEDVRNALVGSLALQDKPVVQIALIQLLVEIKEEKAKQTLEEIAGNETMDETVRDEANYGLIRL